MRATLLVTGLLGAALTLACASSEESAEQARAGWLLEETVRRFPERDDAKIALARVAGLPALIPGSDRARNLARGPSPFRHIRSRHGPAPRRPAAAI